MDGLSAELAAVPGALVQHELIVGRCGSLRGLTSANGSRLNGQAIKVISWDARAEWFLVELVKPPPWQATKTLAVKAHCADLCPGPGDVVWVKSRGVAGLMAANTFPPNTPMREGTDGVKIFSMYDILYGVFLGGGAGFEWLRRNDLDLRVPLRFVPVAADSDATNFSFYNGSDTQKSVATNWVLREDAERMGLRNIAA